MFSSDWCLLQNGILMRHILWLKCWIRMWSILLSSLLLRPHHHRFILSDVEHLLKWQKKKKKKICCLKFLCHVMDRVKQWHWSRRFTDICLFVWDDEQLLTSLVGKLIYSTMLVIFLPVITWSEMKVLLWLTWLPALHDKEILECEWYAWHCDRMLSVM